MKKIIFTLLLCFTNIFLSGTRFFNIKRYILNLIGIRVGENSKIVGPITINSEAKLRIGSNCWIGRDLIIDGNGTVEIGDECDLSSEILIQTGSHEIGYEKRRAGKGINYDVKIRDGCWLGGRVTIIEGSCIGEACVIGACTLVNKTVDSNNIGVGIPIKIIKKLNLLEDKRTSYE